MCFFGGGVVTCVTKCDIRLKNNKSHSRTLVEIVFCFVFGPCGSGDFTVAHLSASLWPFSIKGGGNEGGERS